MELWEEMVEHNVGSGLLKFQKTELENAHTKPTQASPMAATLHTRNGFKSTSKLCSPFPAY